MTIDQLHRELGFLIDDGWEGLPVRHLAGSGGDLTRVRVRHATVKRAADGGRVPDLHVALEFKGEEVEQP